MRKLLLLIALATLCVPALADTAQQQKMKSCNAEAKAKGLKGDEYKKFRNNCLKATPTAPAAAEQKTATPAAPAAAEQKTLTPQQEKMKKCNGLASSQGLKGDARSKFMSSCLKG
ncbi:MAG TPA: PsiF family protein [Burkholderiales bacterium]|nr:PsiF family protein [Burkholderiales bacterium]